MARMAHARPFECPAMLTVTNDYATTLVIWVAIKIIFSYKWS